MTSILLISMVTAIFLLRTTCDALDFHYHNYSAMAAFLHGITTQNPQKSALYEIGRSGQGRPLWAVAISATQPRNHLPGRPEVKFIGNMHGNEVVGLEMLLHLIEYLLTSTNVQVRRLLETTRVWIMPSMNPDGLEISHYGDCSSARGRYTTGEIDLNRNFPDFLGDDQPFTGQASETKAVMNWLQELHFVLSANFHGGTFLINVPFDRYYDGRTSISADDDIYQMLGRRYIQHIIETNDYCDPQHANTGFVTRGADWYEVIGGMQDYGYLNYGTIEMTMEISCCKYPHSNILLHYWNYNRDAMIDLLLQTHRGIKGFILDENRFPIPLTEVMIDERRPVLRVTPLGEFWRILLPGNYVLRVFYRGHEIYQQPITILDLTVPMNVTIIIPKFKFIQYINPPTLILSPFEKKSTGSSSSISSFFLLVVLHFCCFFG